MRLLLIRHGETVDNVSGIYAGITDSPLTTHGVLQASRLGAHLATTGIKTSHIFSSDLQRAVKTAEAIRLAQPDPPGTVTQLQLLREQDFGFYEGKHFHERPKNSEKSGREAHRELHANMDGSHGVESKQSMIQRMEFFIDGHLLPLLQVMTDSETVAVVAHGIILGYLWRCILARFETGNVSIAAGIMAGGAGTGLEYLGNWSNTGYLDLELTPKVTTEIGSSLASTDIESSNKKGLFEGSSELIALPPASKASTSNILSVGESASSAKQSDTSPSTTMKQPSDTTTPDGSTPISQNYLSVPQPATNTATITHLLRLPHLALVVKAVNSQEHLKGLKKTRGGIGSLKHDDKQQTMESFFKRRKLD